MQKVQVQVGVQDQASAPIQTISDKFDSLKQRVEGNTGGINRLNGAFQQMGTQMVGLTGTSGQLAQSLLQFAPGGIIAGAVVAGLALIISKVNELREAERKRQEDIQNRRGQAMEARVGAEDARTTLRGGAGQTTLNQAEAESRVLADMVRVTQRLIAEQDRLIERYTALSAAGSSYYKGKLLEAQAIRQSLILGESDAEGKELSVGLAVLEQRQAEANLALQTARVSVLADERKRILEYNQLAGETIERNRRLVVVNEELLRIANTTSFSDDIRLAALRSLNSEKQKEEKAAKAVVITDEQRLKALEALHEQNRLSTADAQTMRNLENQFLAVLNSNTASYLERAAALATLSGYYGRLKAAQDEQLAREKKMEESLGRFNIALETRNKNIQNAALSLGRTDVEAQTVLTDRLAVLRTEIEQTSDIVTRANLAGQIKSIEEELMGTDGKFANAFVNFTTYAELATQSYGVLFDTIANGGGTLTKFGQGMLRMFSQLARGKAVENIAYAVENLAKAFGFAAVGNLPSAAAAKAAAASHFKAAALWGAVGLGSGAASAANGGGFSNSGVGQDNVTDSRGSATLIINGGFLNMNDPRQLNELQKALGQLTGRRVVVQGR